MNSLPWFIYTNGGEEEMSSRNFREDFIDGSPDIGVEKDILTSLFT